MFLKEKIDDTINRIEEYCSLVLLNQDDMAIEYLPIMVEGIGNTLPDIVMEYDKEYLLEKKNEQIYWVDQLQRIMGALEGKDAFYKIDVLLNETVENLKIFMTY